MSELMRQVYRAIADHPELPCPKTVRLYDPREYTRVNRQYVMVDLGDYEQVKVWLQWLRERGARLTHVSGKLPGYIYTTHTMEGEVFPGLACVGVTHPASFEIPEWSKDKLLRWQRI